MNHKNNELNCITNFFSHSYISHICITTKVNDQLSTCSNLIWTILENVELSGAISYVNVTDHFLCSILFSFSWHEKENILKAFIDLSQDNINIFSDIFQEINNNFMVNENDDVKVNLTMYGFCSLHNEYFPIRRKSI